jgi:hypothetical protein
MGAERLSTWYVASPSLTDDILQKGELNSFFTSG